MHNPRWIIPSGVLFLPEQLLIAFEIEFLSFT